MAWCRWKYSKKQGLIVNRQKVVRSFWRPVDKPLTHKTRWFKCYACKRFVYRITEHLRRVLQGHDCATALFRLKLAHKTDNTIEAPFAA